MSEIQAPPERDSRPRKAMGSALQIYATSGVGSPRSHEALRQEREWRKGEDAWPSIHPLREEVCGGNPGPQCSPWCCSCPKWAACPTPSARRLMSRHPRPRRAPPPSHCPRASARCDSVPLNSTLPWPPCGFTRPSECTPPRHRESSGLDCSGPPTPLHLVERARSWSAPMATSVNGEAPLATACDCSKMDPAWMAATGATSPWPSR